MEQKLVDINKLDAEMYRKSFETDDGRQQWHSGLWIRYKIWEEARNNAPTVDAVPVIRCKDCKYCTMYRSGDRGNCIYTSGTVYKDEYCSMAERRKDDNS